MGTKTPTVEWRFVRPNQPNPGRPHWHLATDLDSACKDMLSKADYRYRMIGRESRTVISCGTFIDFGTNEVFGLVRKITC